MAVIAGQEGGCLCGRVRYRLRQAPLRSYLCHCRDCQRAGGAGFTAAMLFPPGAVELRGELAAYDVAGESGRVVRRRFCPTCGSGVVNGAVPDEGFAVVLAGTLDEPGGFMPEAEIFCRSAFGWLAPVGRRMEGGWEP